MEENRTNCDLNSIFNFCYFK